MKPIDWKYTFEAINPVSGNKHSQDDAVVFLAKDRAFLLGALPAYLAKCVELGADSGHLAAINLLIERVAVYQDTVESKVPDTNRVGEINRCVYGAVADVVESPKEYKNHLTLTDVNAVIINETYHRPFPEGTMTICLLTLANGAKVEGVNYGPVDATRQDWKLGEKLAREKALARVWELEGYLVRQRLLEGQLAVIIPEETPEQTSVEEIPELVEALTNFDMDSLPVETVFSTTMTRLIPEVRSSNAQCFLDRYSGHHKVYPCYGRRIVTAPLRSGVGINLFDIVVPTGPCPQNFTLDPAVSIDNLYLECKGQIFKMEVLGAYGGQFTYEGFNEPWHCNGQFRTIVPVVDEEFGKFFAVIQVRIDGRIDITSGTVIVNTANTKVVQINHGVNNDQVFPSDLADILNQSVSMVGYDLNLHFLIR